MKTRYFDGQETRALIGLQFFAEEAAAADTSAAADTGSDTGAAESDGFLAGLMGEGVEDQHAESHEDGKDGQTDGENQTGESQQEAAQNETQKEGVAEGAQAAQDVGGVPEGTEQRVPTTTLSFNGRIAQIPTDAVQALTRALGTDAVALLQKGLNYENRGAREISILDRYAQANGVNRDAYISQMENSVEQFALNREIERVRGNYPAGTPEEALRTIAQGNLATQKQQQEAANSQRQQQEQQQKMQALVKPWRALFDAHPEWAKDRDQMPKEIMEGVLQGLSPLEAASRHERDQALGQIEGLQKQIEELKGQVSAEKKNNQNRQTTPGSMQGAGDSGNDPFLSGLFANI